MVGPEQLQNRHGKTDCLTIAAVGVLLAVLLQPFQNTPFIDDWVYAWPVLHLLENGRIVIPEYSGNPPVIQILWGALFCLPFGFSFKALALSTWVLWIGLLCGVYLCVRELGGRRRDALLGAATLAVFPTCFVLAPSFMTDVPFLAAAVLSSLVFLRAIRLRRSAWVWGASVLACGAIGIRYTGIALPVAMLATLLLHMGHWGRQARVWAAPLISLPFTGALLILARSSVLRSADMSAVGNAPQARMAYLPVALKIAPAILPITLVFIITAIGLALMPLALASIRRRALRRSAWMACVALIGLWLLVGSLTGRDLWVPLMPGETWAVDELGASAALVPEWVPRVPYAVWCQRAVTFLCLALAGLLGMAWPRRAFAPGEYFLAWLMLGQVCISVLLWLYGYDRYALIFVVIAIVLFLGRRPELRPGVAIAGICLYAFCMPSFRSQG